MTTEQEKAEFRALVESLSMDQQERAEFEAWARKHGQPVFRDDEEPECYAYSNVQDNWTGWQARAALQSQDREDAERYRWLRDTLHGAKAGGGIEVNKALQFYETPKPGEEVQVYWYQDTAVGFYEVHGTTLDEAIDHARRVEGDGE